MTKKLEVREGDRILVWLDLSRVTEDEQDRPVVTVLLPGQRVTAPLRDFDIVKHEKGGSWPN